MKYSQDLVNINGWHNFIVDDNLVTEREAKDD